MRLVRPQLTDLFNIIETEFHPLSICEKISPILTEFEKNEEEVKYVEPLRKVVVSRLLQQLSQVYTTINIEFLSKLVNHPPVFKYSDSQIEVFILNECKKGELNIKIAHNNRTIHFNNDNYSYSSIKVSEGSILQTTSSEKLRNQLLNLTKKLHTASLMIDSTEYQRFKKRKDEAFRKYLQEKDEHNKELIERKYIIEKKKEIMETIASKKEKDEDRKSVV